MTGENGMLRDSTNTKHTESKAIRRKRLTSLLLAASITLTLTACGGGGAGNAGGSNAADAGEFRSGQIQGTDLASADGQTAMGRYVEEEIDLSSQLWEPCSMNMLEDGSIVIMDGYAGILVSGDRGSTWSNETPDWLNTMIEEQIYIGTMTMAPDGTAAVVYDPRTNTEDYIDGYQPVMKLVLPDGTEVPTEFDLTEEDIYVRQVAAGEDGNFYANTFESIYEVHRDGSSEKILTPESNAQHIWVKDNLLFMDNGRQDGDMPVIYDMETGEYIEDEVLTDFVNANYTDRYYNGGYWGTMSLLPGEDETVCVVGAKGIHRHAIGGNMMEQIVDGNLSLLNNPNYNITAMLQLGEDTFLALFSNTRIIRFTYDPDMPTVPEKMLTIYSLRDNDDLRQAISLYQMENPDTFVSYEVGMDEGDSVTREDAIKKLNTEIMAGTGPDLIVMDDLPINSYVSKGMLLDLTDYLAEYSAKEPLFDNIIEAIKYDGKAYMAPATITVPMIAAPEEYAKKMTDLSGVAEATEELRGEHPGENIIDICTEIGVMKRFAPTSAPKWVMADGTLDTKSMGEYLKQCKRIYDAQMDGLDEEVIREDEEWREWVAANDGIDADRADWSITRDHFGYIGGSKYILSGWLISAYGYMTIQSLDKTPGYEDTKVIPMQGQCSNIFMPETLLGINAASGQIDAAKGFMDVFLSARVQNGYNGFALNREAFDIQFTPDEEWLGENNEYSYQSMTYENGLELYFIGYWPTDEQIAAFKKELASTDTAYIPDTVLEDAVFRNGQKYISGEYTLEEALGEIEKAVSIYMAE